MPDYGYQQPTAPPPPRPRRSGWQLAPATYVLTGINIAVYLVMVLSGVSPTSPSGEHLIHWGANVGVLVLADHEWWRLVTSTFVHSGIIHIATNMWCLYNLGLLGEPLMGAFGVVAAYLLTGVAGNLLSVALHPGVVSAGQVVDPGVISVGASGAVFGIAGVLIPLLGSKLLPVDRGEVARLRRSVIYFAVLNFVIGFGADAFNTRVRIDNMAHLGGFLSGILLGMLLVPKLGADRKLWMRRQWLAFGSVLLIILLGARFLASFWRA
jgi:rhomboid protease GluP